MITFFNDSHQAHAPEFEFFRGERVPCFETPARAEYVKASLRARGHTLRKAESDSREVLSRVHAPRYLAFGGLVFQPLTRDYLTTWDTWWNNAPKELLTAHYLGRRTPERHELIVLTEVLEGPMTTGYDAYVNETVVRVEGAVPRDLSELAQLLDAASGTVALEMSSGALIVCVR